MLTQLKDLVNTATQNALFVNTELHLYSVTVIRETISIAANQSSEDFDKLLHTIEDLKDQLGEAALPCIDEQQNTINGLPEQIYTGVNSCINIINAETGVNIQSVMKKIDNYFNVVNSLEYKFSACTDVTCYNEVLYAAQNYLDTIPGNIEDLIQKIIRLASQSQAAIQECGRDELIKYEQSTTEIVKAITDCASKR